MKHAVELGSDRNYKLRTTKLAPVWVTDVLQGSIELLQSRYKKRRRQGLARPGSRAGRPVDGM